MNSRPFVELLEDFIFLHYLFNHHSFLHFVSHTFLSDL